MFSEENVIIAMEEFDFPEEYKTIIQKVNKDLTEIKSKTKNEIQYIKKRDQYFVPIYRYFLFLILKKRSIVVNVTLQRILVCPVGVTYMFEFLKNEFSEELISCYLTLASIINKLEKKNLNVKEIQEEIKKFTELYIVDNAVEEMNLPGKIKKEYLSSIQKEVGDNEEEWKDFIKTEKVNLMKQIKLNLSDPFQRFKFST
jgi:hypothetical protein